MFFGSRGLAFVLAAGACFEKASADSFGGLGAVDPEEAKKDLEAELTDSVEKGREQHFMEALESIYTALPKNAHGNLDHQEVRYALHRMFAREHSWFFGGLDPSKASWDATSEADLLSGWVPPYLVDFMERRLGNKGVGLHDLGALAAALEDLTRKESDERIDGVLRAMNFPAYGNLSTAEGADSLTVYLIVYLVAGHFTFMNRTDVENKAILFTEVASGWNTSQKWLKEFVGRELPSLDLNAPQGKVKVTEIKRTAFEIGMQFGAFNDQECQGLKNALLTSVNRSRKAGRVRLADFYKHGLESRWNLSETAEFLDVLGALDTTNKSNPMVIIPNYITSRPNCLDASDLYSLCCRNECEDLLGEVEKAVKAPTASVEMLTQALTNISTTTVPAPVKFAPQVLQKLEQVANMTGGEVNIYSHAFAEWLHHAYPNECAFPRPGAATASAQWVGEEMHTDDELRRFIEADRYDGEEASLEDFMDLPWGLSDLGSPFEVLSDEGSNIGNLLVLGGMLMSLVAFAINRLPESQVPPAVRSVSKFAARLSLSWQPLGGAAVLCGLYKFGFVDRVLFVFLMGTGFVVLAMKIFKVAKVANNKLPQ